MERLDEPTVAVTAKIYSEDLEKIKKKVGTRGVSAYVRDAVRMQLWLDEADT